MFESVKRVGQAASRRILQNEELTDVGDGDHQMFDYYRGPQQGRAAVSSDDPMLARGCRRTCQVPQDLQWKVQKG